VLASRHPERVRSLAVVSTPHPGALRTALDGADPGQVQQSSYISLFRQAEEPEKLLLGPDGSGDGLRKLFEPKGSVRGVDAEVVAEYVAVLTQPGALTAALNWYRAMTREEVADLAPITVPTLYVWSTEDMALGRVAAEATEDHVSGPYRFEVLEGVSHWVPEEVPDVLNGLLLDLLAAT
jgi:pimeloyl-ACP methyl ester carboxylesterase